MEMAGLKERGTEVTLVEAADQVFAPAARNGPAVSQQLKLQSKAVSQ